MTGDRILLSHGEGGKKSRDLIRKIIAKRFDNPILSPLFDSGLLGRLDGEIAFTEDFRLRAKYDLTAQAEGCDMTLTLNVVGDSLGENTIEVTTDDVVFLPTPSAPPSRDGASQPTFSSIQLMTKNSMLAAPGPIS